jgi:hypothetical protein
MKAPLTRIVAVAACITVAACDSLPRSPFNSSQQTETAPAATAATAQPQPSRQPTPEPAPAPRLEIPEAAHPELAALNVEKLPGPEHLLSLDGDGVEALLGPPAFSRRDDPARIWQYENRMCFLDVFLYQETNALRVAHVEVRNRSVVAVSDKECFLGLLTTHLQPKN